MVKLFLCRKQSLSIVMHLMSGLLFYLSVKSTWKRSFYKLLYGFYNLNVPEFVPFVNHTHTRHCKNPSLVLKVTKCKTSTFQSSFFNRIFPLWNCICTLASLGDFLSIVSFKTFLSRAYLDLLTFTFDVNNIT